MPKPEPSPLPSNNPPQFPPPPPPPQQKTVPQSFVEFITAFDKPLTKDEKIAWLGEIAHRVLNNELPQEIYPFLRDKIESLPEAIPFPERPPEKIPGSDYIHPDQAKKYVSLIRENPTFISDDLQTKPKTYRQSNESDSSFATLIGVALFLLVCFIAYGVGSWYMKSPLKKNGNDEIAAVAPEPKPVAMEVKTDDPFAEVATDNPFKEPVQEVITDDPFAEAPADNPFAVASTTLKELDKEVFRLTLKLDENGRCSYKTERTKTPLPENYEGQIVDLFPNAKSWKNNNGTITTIHDFSKHDSLNDLFLPRDDKSRARLSLDKSTGRLVMQYGPKLFWDGGCTAKYGKETKLPIEITVDIADIELSGNGFTSDFIVFCGTDNANLRFIYNGSQFYVRWTEQGKGETTIHGQDVNDFQVEGTFDFPKYKLSSPLSFGLQSFTGQPRVGKHGITRLVTKGRFSGEEYGSINTDNPFGEDHATDNPFDGESGNEFSQDGSGPINMKFVIDETKKALNRIERTNKKPSTVVNLPYVYIHSAVIQFCAGEKEEAKKTLEKAIKWNEPFAKEDDKIYSASYFNKIAIAQAAILIGQKEIAEKIVDEIGVSNIGHVPLLFALDRDADAAIAVGKGKSGADRGLLALANEYWKKGDSAKVEELLTSAESNARGDIWFPNRMAEFWIGANKADKAQDIINRIETGFVKGTALKNLAVHYLETGNFEQAKKTAADALRLFKDHTHTKADCFLLFFLINDLVTYRKIQNDLIREMENNTNIPPSDTPKQMQCIIHVCRQSLLTEGNPTPKQMVDRVEKVIAARSPMPPNELIELYRNLANSVQLFGDTRCTEYVVKRMEGCINKMDDKADIKKWYVNEIDAIEKNDNNPTFVTRDISETLPPLIRSGQMKRIVPILKRIKQPQARIIALRMIAETLHEKM